MRTLGEQRIDPFILPYDPNAIILLILFADFTEGVVGWQPYFQDRRRLKEDSGEGRANKTEQSG